MALQKGSGGDVLTVFQPHTGRTLGREEFLDDIRRRVKFFVSKYELFDKGDTLLLGLSGGKDSFVLLDTLAWFHSPSKMIGLSIVEGIPGYNKHSDIARMVEIARGYGIDVVVTSFRDYVGHSLYEIMRHAWRSGLKVSACTFCGILRRRILNFYARSYGASYVVTGHNLDDTAQTLIINLLRGDFGGMLKEHPARKPPSTRMVPRIKPLRMIYEWETSLYAYMLGFPFQETECMYITTSPTLRAKVRRAIQRAENMQPGIILRFVEYIDDLLSPVANAGPEITTLPLCPRCGEPMNVGRRVCKLCELMEEAGIRNPVYHYFYTARGVRAKYETGIPLLDPK